MAENVLVTGGAGYVGSHCCKALAEAGFVPVTYDDLSRGHERAVRFGPLERGDLLDRARLDSVIARHRPAAVLHFAGLISVAESAADPLRYYRTNVAGSLVLIEAAAAAGIGAIVYSSSAAVYGAPAATPIPEDAPLAPASPYGRTKLMVEQMLADAAGPCGFRYAALRYFNAAGAAPEDGLGEDHAPETHLIPLALAAADGTGPALTIHGADYPTPDGTCIRDYVHVRDLADAHVRALGQLLEGGGRVVLNLGTGRGHSVREVIDAAARVTGREVPAAAGPRRPGDPPVLVADPARAHDLLGWRAARPDLETMIADAWRWQCCHSGGGCDRG